MHTSDRVRWWVGWHPLSTVAAGGVVGFLVANLLYTWGARALLLRGTVEDVTGPLFHPLVGDGGLYYVVIGFVPVILIMVVGAVVGAVAWWAAGVRLVNERGPGVLESTVADDGEDPAYVLVAGRGAVPLVDPSREYDVTRFHLDDAALAIERLRVRMVDRTVSPVDEGGVAYDQIASVGYDRDALVVVTNAGDEYRFPSGDEPTTLLRALDERGLAGHPGPS